MAAVAGGATKTNGHAAVRAVAHSDAREPRSAVDRIEEWLDRQVAKGGRGLDLRLAQKGRASEIDRWKSDELPSHRELAMAVHERATDEANAGLDGVPSFELQSLDGDGKVRAYVPFAVRLAPRSLTSEDVFAKTLDLVERQEGSLHKFVAAIFAESLESSEINRKSFRDREEASEKSHANAIAHFRSIVDTQGTMIERLLTEREKYVSTWMDMTSRNAELELEAKREDRKAQMKQQVFDGMIRPHLPLIAAKLAAAFKMTPPAMAPAPATAAPATAPVPTAPAPAAPAPATSSNNLLTDAQASALWSFLYAVESSEIEAMADTLPPEKRKLLVEVVGAFIGGAS